MKDDSKPVYGYERVGALFRVMRNGRPLMTPAGAAYDLTCEAVAKEVVAEWEAQGEKIVPATMPFTQFAATALDVLSKKKGEIIDGLLAYMSSELLCHRAERPESLAQKQHEIWQPLLDWSAKAYGVDYTLGCGVMPLPQKQKTIDLLRGVLDVLDLFVLAGLSSAVDTSGSLVLGLALMEGRITPDEALAACELDARHQAETWGVDPVMQARHESMLKDLEACARWFTSLRSC